MAGAGFGATRRRWRKRSWRRKALPTRLGEQIEIVASLMEVSADEARGAVLRLGQRKDVEPRHDRQPHRRAARRGGRAPDAAPPAAEPVSDRRASEPAGAYSQRRAPGSEMARFATSRCQMNRTTSAPTTAPISPAPWSGRYQPII